MNEAFAFQPAVEKEEKKEKNLLEKSKELLEEFEGPNGEQVFAKETVLLNSAEGLSAPLSYYAFPLNVLEMQKKLDEIKKALNLYQGNKEGDNPFVFTINYDFLEWVDEDGKKHRNLLMTDEEKLEAARKVREEAIAFVEKWSDMSKIEDLLALAESMEEVNDIKDGLQSAFDSLNEQS